MVLAGKLKAQFAPVCLENLVSLCCQDGADDLQNIRLVINYQDLTHTRLVLLRHSYRDRLRVAGVHHRGRTIGDSKDGGNTGFTFLLGHETGFVVHFPFAGKARCQSPNAMDVQQCCQGWRRLNYSLPQGGAWDQTSHLLISKGFLPWT
jgi:hypothetical protein